MVRTIIYNERNYFNELMKKENKSVESLEAIGMCFDNRDLIITFEKSELTGNYTRHITDLDNNEISFNSLSVTSKNEIIKEWNELQFA
ncbi:hypothetical protein [Paenibacillus terrae]|uniref:Uncharacterized protein n=1 Tax=Paenibacillus terrae TaxID=159743 RepID=A0A0D7WWQ9_9BACL|nr:hypothetical protein [Paenibacillus terrae]KJD43621.1 hypothetical protein QD47_21775 [Paenibacillus terrae]